MLLNKQSKMKNVREQFGLTSDIAYQSNAAGSLNKCLLYYASLSPLHAFPRTLSALY